MIEIWGRKNSSNVIPVMWALGELGIEHVRHNVGGSFGGLDTPEYGAKNPNRLVPTLEVDGFVLWESNAIVRYLSRKHGGGTLCPGDEQGCAIADQWMDWAKTTLNPVFFPIFWGLIRTPEADQDHDRIRQCALQTGKKLEVVERRLEQSEYLAGDGLTMGDLPLGALIYRYFNLDIERPSLPALEAWYGRLCERPAYRQHAMIPIGSSLEEWNRLEREGAGG